MHEKPLCPREADQLILKDTQKADREGTPSVIGCRIQSGVAEYNGVWRNKSWRSNGPEVKRLGTIRGAGQVLVPGEAALIHMGPDQTIGGKTMGPGA